MTFHNLCAPNVTLPPATANLLGNGLKYCIETPRPHQQLDRSIQRFQRSIRLHFQFNGNSSDTESTDGDDLYNTKYIPSLYIPSTWDPPIQSDAVEHAFSKFDELIDKEKRLLPSNRRYNLSVAQRNVLQELQNRPDLIIYPTDKNLGPYIMDHP
jgi:hypothetical protein